MEAGPYFQTAFSPSEFQRRRRRLCDAIGEGTALLQGAPETGAFSLFRQYNDFFYFCGVETSHAYLLVDGRSGQSTLYLLPRDERASQSDGPELNADDAEIARRLTGVDDIKPIAALPQDLPHGRRVFVCQAAAEGRQACQDTLRYAAKRLQQDPLRGAISAEAELCERIGAACGEVGDLSPIVAEMRALKSEAELQVMRRAGALTAEALKYAIRLTQPGVYEYQLAAAAEFVFLAGGAMGGAYRPIVASADNIWNMHYYRNNRRLEAGDVVLMDYAPDVACYTSDIGRMWPVAGAYPTAYRDLYGFVVDYHCVLLELIRPGESIDAICRRAAERMRPVASRIRWQKESHAAAVENMLANGRPFTHPVGMAVHDGEPYLARALEPGVVFALDPQLWVPEERLYVRVEDAVAVVADGVENLTAAAPHALDEVERLVGTGGALELLDVQQ
ncbi:MAG: aminopeptidase P N-terminal domain-containing protein [Planctomycetales bacterium]|nr:aminopeptidase P N-terminal domain-containing protein [Planctomycetales bacterium]